MYTFGSEGEIASCTDQDCREIILNTHYSKVIGTRRLVVPPEETLKR